MTNKEAATTFGMTLEEASEWQDAFLHLQGRAGNSASAVPLARMLRRGRDIPSMVAFTIADFLDGNEGGVSVILKPVPNGGHTPRMTRARNFADRVRIGKEIIRDRDTGMTVAKAVERRMKGTKFSRSYLMKCYGEARQMIGDPSKYEWVTDPEELADIARRARVARHSKTTRTDCHAKSIQSSARPSQLRGGRECRKNLGNSAIARTRRLISAKNTRGRARLACSTSSRSRERARNSAAAALDLSSMRNPPSTRGRVA